MEDLTMKKLNTEEIKQFADALCMTEQEAKEVTDLFYKLKMENPINNWKVSMPLNDVDEYIREWENHWHRELNWNEYYDYEKENYMYCYADTDAEAEKIFESIETFKNCVSSHSYELSDGLIVIVC
jgi:hypothetical protein